MGIAISLGLILIAIAITVTIIGVLIYGGFVGLASLARRSARLWLQLAYPDEEVAVLETGVPGEGPAGARSHQVPSQVHCWDIKQCSAAVRESCPAYHAPDLPCWLACMQAGKDPSFKPACLACKLFNLNDLAA